MSTNPYQPPSDPSSLDSSTTEAAVTPRYHGGLTMITGSVDEADAISLAKACQLPETSDVIQSRPKTSWWGISFVLLILLPIIVLLDLNSVRFPTLSSLNLTLVACFLVVVGIFVALLLILTTLNARRFVLADPPLGGSTTIRLNEFGLSVEKQTRDARELEIFCSWRQVQATVCDSAWLLNLGFSSPVLVMRDWVAEQHERAIFDALVSDIAQWSSEQPLALDLESIPAEAAEAFPDYKRDAIPLVVSTRAEKKARRAIRRSVAGILPDYRIRPANTPMLAWAIGLWRALLAALVASILWTVFEHQLNHIGEGPVRLVALVLPQVAFLLFSIWLTIKVNRDVKIAGALSGNELWFDHRSLLLRFPLDSLRQRLSVDQTLVLATETGSTTIVLPASYFESREDFQRASAKLLP
ncbi:hypothetical protein [Rhodopirellula sp. MGV]|uniref:hypothetical protein n=1 Tax=Rhodopirellula sp. MGV TaxID=2023130 RepID=UPI000B960EC2|nr:hypothetical protein [Rhodopirellula sp. MGV]OYP29842.1 hypothetical protein CGZ80_23925 [Rhodopirellula sp. MGV]PNY33724.1 hypothetical protein C2E31_26900 [Rhodopirellula baltica]